MQTSIEQTTPLAPLSKKTLRIGAAVSALPVAFLIFDSVIKLPPIEAVVNAFAQLGYPLELARGIGTLELVCIALYVVPRSAVLGALLLTGFLGGAVATHLRVGDPLASHTLFPCYVAALLWAGLYLRDRRVRALFIVEKRTIQNRNPNPSS